MNQGSTIDSETLDILLQELPVNWKMMLGIGIFMILAGTLGFFLSVYLTLGSILIFGVLLATGGIMQLVQGIKAREKRWLGKTQHFAIAILYLLAGGLIVWDPLAASAGMTLVLAAFFAALGVTRIWYALRCRRRQWRWVLPVLSGLINLALAAVIMLTWPESSLWVLGLLIAIELLANGWLLTFIALRVKQVSRS